MENIYNIQKTNSGTLGNTKDGEMIERSFKFEPSDIGKYIVIKFRYEEHLFCGAPLGTRLMINNHILHSYKDYLYGVYLIDWHDDYQKSQKNINYKIKLVPIENWKAWCPSRSWYTGDIEYIINIDYNLFEEIPIFDNIIEAQKFALEKNHELYPYTPTKWEKFKNWIKKLYIV